MYTEAKKKTTKKQPTSVELAALLALRSPEAFRALKSPEAVQEATGWIPGLK